MKHLLTKPLDALSDRFPQVSLAFTSALWGAIVALPNHSFDGTSFAVVETIANEFHVGMLFLIAGAVNLHCLITESWRGAMWSAILLMFLWATIGLLFIAAGAAQASWVLVIGLAWLFGWSAVESKFEHMKQIKQL